MKRIFLLIGLSITTCLASIGTLSYSGKAAFTAPLIVPFTTYYDGPITVQVVAPQTVSALYLMTDSGAVIDWMNQIGACGTQTSCSNPTFCSISCVCNNGNSTMTINEVSLPAGNYKVEYYPDLHGKKVSATVYINGQIAP